VNPTQVKVDQINSGKTPIIEKDSGEAITEAVRVKRLSVTTSVDEAIANTEMS